MKLLSMAHLVFVSFLFAVVSLGLGVYNTVRVNNVKPVVNLVATESPALVLPEPTPEPTVVPATPSAVQKVPLKKVVPTVVTVPTVTGEVQ